MTRLSVTIVAYNNYNDIKEAILSIDKYSTIDKKMYIVDNGVSISKAEDTDDFLAFLRRYSDIEYIDARKNIGFGKGHNLVIDKLDSQYHAIVNPDILLEENSFFKIIEWMDTNHDVGMVIPEIVDEKGDRQLVYREELTVLDMFIRFFCKGLFPRRIKKHTMQDKDYTKPFQVPFGQGSFLVVRTDLFRKLEGFDERFFMYVEDADLCKRVNQISKLMYYPGTKVIHKWEQGSHKNKELLKYHIRSMIEYFKKWGWKLS